MIVEEIRKKFVQEAISSPTLISDLASMEKYISESYDGRSLIELLQNADDAVSTEFYLEKIDDSSFLVANNGRTFTKDDLISLCRSGASTKKRKSNTIGFRGIGFKSVVNYSNIVHLISGNIRVTFSREKTKELIGENIPVPLIRIPHDFIEKKYDDLINKKIKEGYTTIFIFETNKLTLKSEISIFDSSCMLFLQNVNQIKFTYDENKICNIARNNLSDNLLVANIVTESDINKWLVFKDETKLSNVAFKLENDTAVLSKNENYIHSFMPTKDKFLIPCKINGDFSTDPSRTRIIIDEESISVIKNIALQVCSIIMEAINHKEDKYRLLNVISNMDINPLSNITGKNINDYFYEYLMQQFLDSINQKYNSRKIVIQPMWLSDDDLELLGLTDEYVIKRDLLEKIDGLEKILNVFKINVIEINTILNKIDDIELSHFARLNILSQIIQKYEFNMPLEIRNLIVKANLFKGKNDDIITIESIESIEDIDDNFICELIASVSNIQKIEHFFIKFGIKMEAKTYNVDTKIDNTSNNKNIEEFSKKNIIKKWRSVEENVKLLLEEQEDILEVLDVSKRNIGYDLEATAKNGEKRYYEVKSVNSLGDMFVMTNNELLTASQHPQQYFMCIVHQTDKKIEMCLIKDPANTLNLEKRARVWEYICESYKGEKVERILD